jgi:hypothetical protein
VPGPEFKPQCHQKKEEEEKKGEEEEDIIIIIIITIIIIRGLGILVLDREQKQN